VLVVGAGIVGTAIAARLARAGLDVTVVDRYGPAAGTSSSGEGDLLVSDKLPGPDLAIALRGLERWDELAERAGQQIEFEKKGGLIVAHDEAGLQDLWALARAQGEQGARVDLVKGEDLRQLEPALSRDLPGGVAYEQDCQVQPMLAVAFHVAEVIGHGGRVVPGVDVLGAERDGNGMISALLTNAGKVAVGEWVVNAAGPWAGELARRLGTEIAVGPRRGHVLVTEPLPPMVRRKVFEASYIGSVHQSDAAWACSAVVEATAGGTMLLGSSRESVGFAHEVNPDIVAAIARRAIALVPDLAHARLMRAYVGFRPATPDRLPIIGADRNVGRLLHATGHEGAGVGLSEVTAELVHSLVMGLTPPLDLGPFGPERFDSEPTAGAAPPPTAVPPPSGPPAAPPATGRPPVKLGAAPPPPRDSGDAGSTPASHPAPPPDFPGAGERRAHFRFDGRELAAPEGTTIAGALISNEERTWRTTRTGGQRRGLFCGIGTCFDCLVDVNGEKAVRACVRALRAGDQVGSSASRGLGMVEATLGDDKGTSARIEQFDGQTGTGTDVEMADVVVIGGGPAGMAAASAAAGRGARVVLVDAAPRLGGQFFRQPLLDSGAESPPAGPSLPARFHALAADPLVDLRLGRGVWSVSRGTAGFLVRLDGGPGPLLRSRALVLATGASELALPFPGWDLPGVVTAGAAQALLKSQRIAIGRRVVVAGTGPFLFPVAAALAKSGAQVTAVEAARARTGPKALPGLVAHPGKLAEAAGYAWELARHRVRLLTGRAVVRCEGSGRVERAVLARLGPDWRAVAGSEQTVEADAVCVSYGFVPRLELARQLDAGNPARNGDVASGVACDAAMASATPGLFVAGELAGVAGAEVAELEGEVAGHAAASYAGGRDDRSPSERERLRRRLQRGRAFASGLEALYPLGTGWTSWLDRSTVFCRCEQTTWGSVETAINQGAFSAREVRSVTRCGMGYCQGRTCGPALQLAMSAVTGRPVARVGDLQKRPVAVPVALGQVAGLATPGDPFNLAGPGRDPGLHS
jgi:D-hydroxyproline dehydrogenase subunit alpha